MNPSRPSKSSPLSENPDSSRTPRSSEIGDPMRRSFSGNPFQKPSIVANPRGFNPVTPANSPSDWAVRGRESNTMRFLRESEEKENKTDSNNPMGPAAKSPSINNSKGMKNFMSPTISAASKINASPSKKILTERSSHEQTPRRSSVALLDLRSSCNSISNLSETLEESETRFEKELDLKGPPDKVAIFDSLLESDGLVEDMKPSLPFALEPIDADPLTPMPPYDPKTNFLAPRPKFLYYKPKEMNFNPLDGDVGIFSDSFSESEATEETESDSSQNDSEDDASSQVVVAKEEEAAADTETDLHQPHGIEKEAVAMKDRSRQQFFPRSKCILSAFILLLIATAAMMETDHLQTIRSYNFMINESSFPVVLEVFSKETKYLRSSAGENLRLWCDFSVSYISGLMSELRGEHRHGHVTFFNLTILEENVVKDDNSEISKIFEQSFQIKAEEEEDTDLDSMIEAEVDVDVEEDAKHDDVENSSFTDEEVKSVKVEEAVQSGTAEEVIAVEEENILEEPKLVTIQSGKVEDKEEHKFSFSAKEENILEEEESEAVVAAELESGLLQVEELIPTDIKIAPQDSAETEVPESIKSSSSLEREDNFLRMTQIVALSSVLLSLVAGCLAFKKIRSSSSMAVVSNAAQKEEHFLGAKKFNISPVSGNNNLMAEFDFVGDSSCPSEISSFPLEEHKGPKKRSGALLMNPRKSSSRRRESLSASSSSDMSIGDSASPSLSYGSFTTYEMIPNKKRNGDEELVITPLRRSSRLRK